MTEGSDAVGASPVGEHSENMVPLGKLLQKNALIVGTVIARYDAKPA